MVGEPAKRLVVDRLDPLSTKEFRPTIDRRPPYRWPWSAVAIGLAATPVLLRFPPCKVGGGRPGCSGVEIALFEVDAAVAA